MEKFRINEIFYSLQGEGRWTGRPAIFVRFSGCNLRCDFCDTDFHDFEELDEETLLTRIKEASATCRFIVLTGGEPTLQVTPRLIALLHRHHYYIAMETNGTRPYPEKVDWITCSPKKAFCPTSSLAIQHANEVKVVFDGEHEVSDYGIDCDFHYLQPCDTGDPNKNKEILQGCIAYILEHPLWQLSLQVHKILKIQ